MDIAGIDPRNAASAGAWMTVVHPTTSEDTDWRVHLRGTDSAEFERYIAETEKDNRGKAGGVMKAKRVAIEMMVEMTIGWEGLTENGETVEFSKETAKALYKKHQWLREQVDKFISDRGNFLRSS